MTRVAVIADSQFDGESRFDEAVRLHDWIAQDLAGRGVDLILHAGDVFERRSTPEEREAVAEWVTRCAELAPVVVVRGNHDEEGELAILRRLRTRNPVVVEEAAGVHMAAGVAVACLAWPRRAELLARLRDAGAASAREATEQAAAGALRTVLLGLGEQLARHGGPRVLLAHAMVRGSRVSTGQPLVGCDFELGLEDLALAGADFVALGHVHRAQDWTWNGVPIVYPGSARRRDFGEVEEKSYVLLEVNQEVCGCSYGWKRGACSMCGNRGAVDWTRIPIPARSLLLLHDEWASGEWLCGLTGMGSEADAAGAEVRLRYQVAADQRDAARLAAADAATRLLALGAVSVKLEEQVRPVARARAPEVAAAPTLNGKVVAYWAAKGTMPSAERRASLLAKLHEVEAEVA